MEGQLMRDFTASYMYSPSATEGWPTSWRALNIIKMKWILLIASDSSYVSIIRIHVLYMTLCICCSSICPLVQFVTLHAKT